MKTNKNFFVAIIILLLAVLVLYLFSSGKLKDDEFAIKTDEIDVIVSREVSVVSTFEVPGGEDVVRFTLGLDSEGRIIKMDAYGEFDPSSDNYHKVFADNLLIVIKGKKLADLEEVDKVGTSTLSTDAFNASIIDFKKQI